MPLVPASDTVTLKISLPSSLADDFFEYAKWAKAPRSRVIRIALERLFEDDPDWQEYISDSATTIMDGD